MLVNNLLSDTIDIVNCKVSPISIAGSLPNIFICFLAFSPFFSVLRVHTGNEKNHMSGHAGHVRSDQHLYDAHHVII